MNALLLIPDNVSEVLVKIIRFTDLRRRILHQNLHNVDTPCFTPRDLPVREFAEVLNEAVAEHLRSHRLLFRDTGNIQFGPKDTMRIQPEVDSHAHGLLQTDRDEYVELQVNKLLENSLNRKIAEELLRHKCGMYPCVPPWEANEIADDDNPSVDLPTYRDVPE